MAEVIALGGTITLGAGINDSNGAGTTASSASAYVRICGTTASSANAPITSGVTAYRLIHSTYPTGAYEVSVEATEANGFTASTYYGVYLSAGVGSYSPMGFLGKVYVSSASKTPYDAASRVMDALNSDGAKISANQTVATASYVTAIAPSQTGVAIGTASNVGSVGTVLGTVNAEVVTKTGFSLAADQSSVTVGTASNVGTVATVTNRVTANTDQIEGSDATDQIRSNVRDIDLSGAVTAHTLGEKIKSIDALTEAGGAGDLAAILADTGTDGVKIASGQTVATASYVTALAPSQTGVTIGTASNVGALSAGERSSMSNTIHYYVPTGDEPAGSLAWTTGLQSMRLKDVETSTAATTATRTLYKPDGTSSWGTYVVNTSASGASQITGTSDS